MSRLTRREAFFAVAAVLSFCKRRSKNRPYRAVFKVELYGRVRRAVRVEGRSERAVALEFGISREPVRKMLRYAVPPGYQRQQPVKRLKLGSWLGAIDAILEEDKRRTAKQRHTAKRIF